MRSTFGFFFCLISSSAALFAGKFVASLDRVDNQDKVQEQFKDFTEWHIGVTRKNREGVAMYGFFNLKKDLREPVVYWTTYRQDEQTNEWVKFGIENNIAATNLCGNEKFKKKYYDEYFIGNGSWDLEPECIMRPGIMNISESKALPVDEIAHDIADSFPYGKFKIETSIKSKVDGVQSGGITIIVDIIPMKKNKKSSGKQIPTPDKQIPNSGKQASKNEIPKMGAFGP